MSLPAPSRSTPAHKAWDISLGPDPQQRLDVCLYTPDGEDDSNRVLLSLENVGIRAAQWMSLVQVEGLRDVLDAVLAVADETNYEWSGDA